MGGVVGLVLAAGAGTRFGDDVKQLAPFRGRPLVTWPIAALRAGGVEDVVVVLGAHAGRIAPALVATGGREGLSAVAAAGGSEALRAVAAAGGSEALRAVAAAGGSEALRAVAAAGGSEALRAAAAEGGSEALRDIAAAGGPKGVSAVVAEDWAEGLSASLRAGVAAATRRGADAVMVVLGDQPLLSGAAVAKILAARDPDAAVALRATYDGRPGHPTLIEATMFPAITELRGDSGARELLRGAGFVTCDGLGSSQDADTPEALARLAVAAAAQDAP
jgi:CTP:molybdopterin cytidylyltransferase MocA